jgi:putative SbcD/Mre11-related phosphoesterase
MAVEPVADEPAAVAALDDHRALVVADYHAGIELGLRREGVEIESRAGERRRRLRRLVDETDVDRLVVLGDLGHDIGDPWREERDEIADLLGAVTDRVPVTLVKGNHDGDVEALADDLGLDVAITPSDGVRIGNVGFAHGHTWPAPEVLDAEVVCVGHEHPVVRLEDEVGGSRLERVWLRGDRDPEPFRDYRGTASAPAGEPTDDGGGAADDELVVFPAFNELSGGTRVNVAGQAFLAPFRPDALVEGEAWLLDGTRLGPYRTV